MKAHSRSDSHSHATQAMLPAKRAVVDGTVVQQLQNVETHKRAQNRAAMKCLILLTHFLTKEHVAHSTKFEKLVDVVVRQPAVKAILRNCSKKCYIHIKSGCG